MRKFLLLSSIVAFWSFAAVSQNKTVSSDKSWAKLQESLYDAYEAEYLIRVGDVDNLGFGWPDNFDPFCGRMSEVHGFPWDPPANDLPFMDCIIMPSTFKPEAQRDCGQDGYSDAVGQYVKGPAKYQMDVSAIKGREIKNAWLQFFIDDFQAPKLCSKFRVTIQGKVFAEGEKLLNAIDQTGPVGKLISLKLPEEFYPFLSEGQPFRIAIDELTGAGDGFAIDFIRLLVNRKRQNACVGTIRGTVLEKFTEKPLQNVTVSAGDGSSALTDQEGRFELNKLPTGFEVVSARLTGFADGSGMADVGEGDDNPEVVIYLEPGKQSVKFDQTPVRVGESIQLNTILFDQGKSELRPASFPELDKVVAFLQANPTAEIELSGHTSSEGDIGYNKSLSYRRVKSCKDYITSRNIDAGRVIAVGYGPDRPLVPNDTEVNRAKNRRVELRIVKM